MLDVEELDISLKIRAYGRLINTKHPFLELVKSGLSSEYFFPSCKNNLDSVTNAGLVALRKDKQLMLQNEALSGNRKALATMREIRLIDLVRPRSRNSILIFNLMLRGKTRVGQLTEGELGQLDRIIESKWHRNLKECLTPGVGTDVLSSWEVFYVNKLINLAKASSKEIRSIRSVPDPICLYKIYHDTSRGRQLGI